MVHVGRHIIRHTKSNAEKVLPRIEMKQGLVGISADALSEEMNRIVISDDELFNLPPKRNACPRVLSRSARAKSRIKRRESTRPLFCNGRARAHNF